MTWGAIVLCGGQSARMGRCKASLPFGSELMLERVVRLVADVVGPVVVVGAPDQHVPPVPSHVYVVRDDRPGRGPLEGLAAGLAALQDRADAAYATGCDVPLLVPAFVRRMFQCLGEDEIAVPTADGFHHPLAAVYRIRVLSAVQRLLAADRLRPVFLFQEVKTKEVPVEELRGVDPELHTLENVNTPRDYLSAVSKAGLTPPHEMTEWLNHPRTMATKEIKP
jgi:molybdopterin-guanine dinucleotide biosynthesis protein A